MWSKANHVSLAPQILKTLKHCPNVTGGHYAKAMGKTLWAKA